MKIIFFSLMLSIGLICGCKKGSSQPTVTDKTQSGANLTSTSPSVTGTPTPGITPPPNPTPTPAIVPTKEKYTVLEDSFFTDELGSFTKNGDNLIFFRNNRVTFYNEKNKAKKVFELDLVKLLGLKKNTVMGSPEPSVSNSLLFKTPTRTYVAFTTSSFRNGFYVPDLYLGTLDFEKGYEVVTSFPGVQLPALNYSEGVSLGEILYIPSEGLYSQIIIYDPLFPNPNIKLEPVTPGTNGQWYHSPIGPNKFFMTTDKTLITTTDWGEPYAPRLRMSTFNSSGFLINTFNPDFSYCGQSVYVSNVNEYYVGTYSQSGTTISNSKLFKTDLLMNEKESIAMDCRNLTFFYTVTTIFKVNQGSGWGVMGASYSDLKKIQFQSFPFSSFGKDYNGQFDPTDAGNNYIHKHKRAIGASGNCLYILGESGSLEKMCTE